MKIGICVGVQEAPEMIRLAAELGYDYVELPLAPVMELDDEGFSRIKQILADERIDCECMNVFIPAAVRLTGADADEAKIREYANGALARAHDIGAGIVVLGSGGARNIPEGFSREKAFEQLARALVVISGAAAKFGITIAIEPLNRGETNVIHNLGDADKLMKATGRANIKVLLDYYHFMLESDSPDTLRRMLREGKIVHSHFAEPVERAYPKTVKPEYAAIFDLLRSEGYDARCSIEARLGNPGLPRSEMETGLYVLRKMTI